MDGETLDELDTALRDGILKLFPIRRRIMPPDAWGRIRPLVDIPLPMPRETRFDLLARAEALAGGGEE